MRRVGDVTVRGVDLDDATRCAHYDTERDVVAIEFACCASVFACVECHRERTDHDREVWPPEAFDRPAVLCGVCETRLSIESYLDAEHACPNCDAPFNPGCANHYHCYFDVDADAELY